MKSEERTYTADSLTQDCPVQHSLQFIGGKWRIGILWCLKDGCKRFGEIKRELPGISEKMLMQELKHLQKLHVISRKTYHQIPPKVEYRLTGRGQSLIPVLERIVTWGYADMVSEPV